MSTFDQKKPDPLMNNPAGLSPPPLPNENRDGLQRDLLEHRNGTRHQKLTPQRNPLQMVF